MREIVGGSIPLNFENLNAGECIQGYATVLMQGNAEDQAQNNARKVTFKKTN